MKPFPLDNPCEASWDAMRPLTSGRHCAACDAPVYDLTRLSEAQIRGLVTLSGGRFCARQTVADGELVTAPSTPTPLGPRARTPLSRLPIRAVVAAGALQMGACATTSDDVVPPPTALTRPTIVACEGEPTPAPAPAPDKGPRPAAGATPLPTPSPLPPPPPPQPTVVMAGGIRPQPPGRIFFARKKALITPESQAVLNDAASLLNAEPSFALIAIEGHAATDEGNAKTLTALTLARAEAVRQYLVLHGVDAKRLRVIGRGSDYPLAPNDTAEHRSHNRRAELRICQGEDDCK